MGKNLRLIAVAAALFAIVAAWWWSSTPKPPAPEPSPAVVGTPADVPAQDTAPAHPIVAAPESASSIARAAAEPQAQPSPTPVPKPVGQGYRVIGRVTLAGKGTPVAGSTIRIGYERESQVSDADGRFEFVDLALARVELVSASATATTASARRSLELQLDPARPTQIDIEVTAGARLRGRVVDEQGAGIGGASVRAWCAHAPDPKPAPDRLTTTRNDGFFELEAIGVEFSVEAQHERYVPSNGLRGELVPDQVAEGLVIRMRPALTQELLCLDRQDRPIEGVQLKLESEHSFGQTSTVVPGVYEFGSLMLSGTSNSRGHCTLAPVSDEGGLLRAYCVGFLPAVAQVKPGEQPTIVRLERGASLHGRVTDRAGAPVANANVAFRGPDGQGGMSADDGHFELTPLRPLAEGIVTVCAPGFAAFAITGVVVSAEPTPLLLVTLDPELTLSGIVVDGAGKPQAGAQIEIVGERLAERPDVNYGQPQTVERWCGVMGAAAAADGTFRIERLYEGNFALTARSPTDTALHAKLVVAAGNSDVRLVLDAAASAEQLEFKGQVRDALTGAPVQQFTLIPMQVQKGRGNHHQKGDPEGRFQLRGLEREEIDLWVMAPGYARWSTGPREWTAGVHELDVQLMAKRSFSFELVDASGARILSRGEVEARDSRGNQVDFEVDQGSMPRLWINDGKGSAGGMPADVVTLLFRLRLPSSNEPGEPIEVTVDLRLQPTEVLRLNCVR